MNAQRYRADAHGSNPRLAISLLLVFAFAPPLPSTVEIKAGEQDLYPDVRPCLEKLKQAGFVVGVAGNQTARAERLLRALDLPVDTSDRWGVEKPSPGFFERIIAECRCAPDEIAYVGDRLDNDICPSVAAGMVAVFVRRGPWGYIHATHPDAARAHVRVESLVR